MKRTLVAGALAAAALLPAPAAHADHICVTSGGQDVICTPHPEEWIAAPDQVCVVYNGRPLVCVF